LAKFPEREKVIEGWGGRQSWPGFGVDLGMGLIEGMTSPVSIATGAAGGVESFALRKGLPMVKNLAGKIGKVSGAADIFSGIEDINAGDTGQGIGKALLGTWGYRGGSKRRTAVVPRSATQTISREKIKELYGVTAEEAVRDGKVVIDNSRGSHGYRPVSLETPPDASMPQLKSPKTSVISGAREAAGNANIQAERQIVQKAHPGLDLNILNDDQIRAIADQLKAAEIARGRAAARNAPPPTVNDPARTVQRTSSSSAEAQAAALPGETSTPVQAPAYNHNDVARRIPQANGTTVLVFKNGTMMNEQTGVRYNKRGEEIARVAPPTAAQASVNDPLKFNPPEAPATPRERPTRLPKDLTGAKPRYQEHTPNFNNDVDKAFFIIAQDKPSPREDDYFQFLREATGLDDESIKRTAQEVKGKLGKLLKDVDPKSKEPLPKLWQPDIPPPTTPGSGLMPSGRRTIVRPAEGWLEGARNRARNETGAVSLGPEGVPGGRQNPLSASIDPAGMSNETIKLMDEVAAKTRGAEFATMEEVMHNIETNPAFDEAKRQRLKNGIQQRAFNDITGELPLDPTLVGQTNALAMATLTLDPIPGISSAIGRQGIPLWRKAAYWRSMKDMALVFGRKGAFEAQMYGIRNRVAKDGRALYKTMYDETGKKIKSIGEEAGLHLPGVYGELHDERFPRSFVSQYWPVAHNERAFHSFINQLRADHFESLYNAAKAQGKDVTDQKFLRDLAKTVNVATGHGEITDIGFVKKFANEHFFAPSFQASRWSMINPWNYKNKDPMIRREMIDNLLSTVAADHVLGSLIYLGGMALSSKKPTSSLGNLNPDSISDFSKTTFEGGGQKTVFDTGAGLNTPTRLMAKLVVEVGRTAMNEMVGTRYKQNAFGGKDNPQSFTEMAGRYGQNSLKPVERFFISMANRQGFNSPKNQFDIIQELKGSTGAIFAQDLWDGIHRSPELLPFIIPMAIAGQGAATYGRDR
jgi:hypothetical protein